jgi:hypothetical protein
MCARYADIVSSSVIVRVVRIPATVTRRMSVSVSTTIIVPHTDWVAGSYVHVPRHFRSFDFELCFRWIGKMLRSERE